MNTLLLASLLSRAWESWSRARCWAYCCVSAFSWALLGQLYCRGRLEGLPAVWVFLIGWSGFLGGWGWRRKWWKHVSQNTRLTLQSFLLVDQTWEEMCDGASV